MKCQRHQSLGPRRIDTRKPSRRGVQVSVPVGPDVSGLLCPDLLSEVRLGVPTTVQR